MDPKHLFFDDRLKDGCAYCGTKTSYTRDHVPSKILLDEPYPENIPIVNSCKCCNSSFSEDELYLAALLECISSNSADLNYLKREKIKKAFEHSPLLQRRLSEARILDSEDKTIWNVELPRIENVLRKLVFGHACYELYPVYFAEMEMKYAPLHTLSEELQDRFFYNPYSSIDVLPELGTRAFMGVIVAGQNQFYAPEWIIVQEGRYRYAVTEENLSITVKIVLNEYLACEAILII